MCDDLGNGKNPSPNSSNIDLRAGSLQIDIPIVIGIDTMTVKLKEPFFVAANKKLQLFHQYDNTPIHKCSYVIWGYQDTGN